MGLVATACYGVGLGLVIPTTNLLVAQANPERSAGHLSILNLFWALGALAWPAFAALAAGMAATQLLLAGLALALTVATVLAGMEAFPAMPPRRANGIMTMQQIWDTGQTIPALALAASFFLYVGVEASLTGWAATYAKRLPVVPAHLAVLMPSFFWAALILGRAVAPRPASSYL